MGVFCNITASIIRLTDNAHKMTNGDSTQQADIIQNTAGIVNDMPKSVNTITQKC
ncbi:hypothetical protein [Sporomusa acidovorans]|uniref:hypothetical protein n=1 Tax=Sporomusa acidovorans TaxID=112900 RepID=UPI0035A02774